jgi:hypothetical protein
MHPESLPKVEVRAEGYRTVAVTQPAVILGNALSEIEQRICPIDDNHQE